VGAVPTLKSKQHKSNYAIVFYAIAVLIPVVFFILFESALRFFDYGHDLRLFVPVATEVGKAEYLTTNPDVASRYFPEGYFTPLPPEETFKKRKPDNGYRVFVMGGSTAASWPYPNNVLFSRVLEQRLSDTFPGKYIEVINTGIAAVNSFTLLDFTGEILAQQPDAILIYAGHNEFYGALGAGSTQSVGQDRSLIMAYLALSKLKTFQFIRSMVDGSKKIISGVVDRKKAGHSTLMGQMVGDNSIAYNSETYLNAKHNYEANLTEILTKVSAAGVPVMLSELVSNLRDHPPFISVDDGEHLPASLLYAWANQLYDETMYGMAREAYIMAKDQDGLRFRAAEDINASIYKIAAQFGAPVVPMKTYFENASPNGIIGKELMLEHLHPNADGYMLMSEAFYHTMHNEKFVAQVWDEANIQPDDIYRKGWPVTGLDRALGEIRIINLTDNYPYKPKGPEERSIANYKPKNLVEELAMKVFNDEVDYPQAHVELARHYDAQNQQHLAMREYQALIAAAPNNVTFYLMASEYLLKLKKLDHALDLLTASLAIKETGYAYKWIGQILLIQQKSAAARKYIETAMSYYPEDPQLIYNLGFINISENKIDSAKVSINLLEKIAPDSKQLVILRDMLGQHIDSNSM